MVPATIALGIVLLSVVPGWRGSRPAQSARGPAELTVSLTAADPRVRARAACELRELGDRAAVAIEALGALLSDGSPVDPTVCERRWWRGDDDRTSPGELAASALVAIGSRSYDVLARALSSDAWIARRHAAWALGALDDRRAVPALVAALRDREGEVRAQAAWALGAIDTKEAVEGLVRALGDEDARVRRQAAWALGAIGDSSAAASLILALRDAEAGVRAQAAWALGVVGDSKAVDQLLVALKDQDAGVRRQAAWAIGVIGR